MTEPDIEPGTIVGGDLRVVRVIQPGSIAQLLEAEPVTSADDGTKTPCALKVVTASIGKEPRFRELFGEEARKLGLVKSPLVVPVTRTGIDETRDMPFATMPLVPGEPLGAWFERRGALTPRVAFRTIEQIALALAAAHDQGLTHRDLKPEAVLVHDGSDNERPEVRVLFFGLSKLASEAKRNTTAAMNRPLWMAPEQAETDVVVTPATDAWTLGLMAYYLLTGHLFWKAGRDAGSAMMTLLREVLYDAVPPASVRASEQGCAERLPPGFDAWFGAACARDRQHRFQHAREAIAALAPLFASVIGERPMEAVTRAPAKPPNLKPPAIVRKRAEVPSIPPPSIRRRSRRLIIALAGALAAVTVIAGGLIYYFVQRANDATRREADKSDDDDRHSSDKPKKSKAPLQTWSDLDCPIPVSSHDPIWGDRDAPITLVEFSSFDCRACARAEKTLAVLQREYGEKRLRIVWKNRFEEAVAEAKPVPAPMPYTPGPHEILTPAPPPPPPEAPEGLRSLQAAMAAQAVFELRGSEGFWKFHASAMANPGHLADRDLVGYAVAAGAERDKYTRILTEAAGTSKVSDDSELAMRVGVRDAPRFFINGRPVERSAPIAKIEVMLDVAEQEAAAERKAGTPADKVYVKLATQHFSPALPDAVVPAAVPEDATIYRVPIGDSPIRGPKDALITIVEFGDYQCPYTRLAETTLFELRDNAPSEIRIVWKDNPLPIHRRAEPAAELAREVRAELSQDAFWTAHDQLLRGGDLDDSDLRVAADMAGVDAEGAMAALPIFKFKSAIAKDQALAADLEETGTPTFFINGRRLRGAESIERFKAVIGEEKKRAEAELASGTSKEALYDALTKNGKMPGVVTVTKTADNEYSVARAELEKKTGGWLKLFTGTHFVTGHGLRIEKVESSSLFQQMGLEKGDTIKTANGFDMGIADKDSDVYASLKGGDKLTLVVDHHGKSVTITVHLQ